MRVLGEQRKPGLRHERVQEGVEGVEGLGEWGGRGRRGRGSRVRLRSGGERGLKEAPGGVRMEECMDRGEGVLGVRGAGGVSLLGLGEIFSFDLAHSDLGDL